MKDIMNKQNGRFIISIGRTMRNVHKESEAMFRENGLTMAQFTALEALYHKGDLTVGQIIDAVLSTSGNMTVVIRNLENHGLVERKPNPEDKRSYLISLTVAGTDLIRRVYNKHMELVGQKLAVLSEEEKQTIIKILKKLKNPA